MSDRPLGCTCKIWQVAPDDHDYEPRGGRIEREVEPSCALHGEGTADDLVGALRKAVDAARERRLGEHSSNPREDR